MVDDEDYLQAVADSEKYQAVVAVEVFKRRVLAEGELFHEMMVQWPRVEDGEEEEVVKIVSKRMVRLDHETGLQTGGDAAVDGAAGEVRYSGFV